MMATTKRFKDLVRAHVRDDAKFADALLHEGIDAVLSGEVETGKAILRDYTAARLAKRT
jgi:hypothetical protein